MIVLLTLPMMSLKVKHSQVNLKILSFNLSAKGIVQYLANKTILNL